MSSSIRVAILGEGLAGACLLHALLNHPHLDVHIFESAAEFKEAGAAIGVTLNGLDALGLIGSSAPRPPDVLSVQAPWPNGACVSCSPRAKDGTR